MLGGAVDRGEAWYLGCFFSSAGGAAEARTTGIALLDEAKGIAVPHIARRCNMWAIFLLSNLKVHATSTPLSELDRVKLFVLLLMY